MVLASVLLTGTGAVILVLSIFGRATTGSLP